MSSKVKNIFSETHFAIFSCFFIKSCYMAEPYGRAIGQSHMAEQYGNAIWQSRMAAAAAAIVCA